LFDPFADGGSIPPEAQRLGLEAHASDLSGKQLDLFDEED
jgi:putative DNA methylase